MNLTIDTRGNAGGIRCIATAYFVGTVFSLWLLSVVGVPMPTIPGDAGRDQVVILELVGAFALALGVFPLARGLAGPAPRRLLIMFAFTFVAFSVVTQLQASVFTTIGGSGSLLLFHAIPCLLAASAAVVALLFIPSARDLSRPVRRTSASRHPHDAVGDVVAETADQGTGEVRDLE